MRTGAHELRGDRSTDSAGRTSDGGDSTGEHEGIRSQRHSALPGNEVPLSEPLGGGEIAAAGRLDHEIEYSFTHLL